MLRQLVHAISLTGAITLAGTALAQGANGERERAAEMGREIEALMVALEERSAEFPQVLVALEKGQATIEQADETVNQLIEQLRSVTDAMEDESEFDKAIDSYKVSTTELIAEAEASDNEAIRGVLPQLRETLDGLNRDDEDRAQTVIEARNVIAQLEENREAIAFFIRAGAVQEAATLISENIADFGDIVDRGKVVASGLINAANP